MIGTAGMREATPEDLIVHVHYRTRHAECWCGLGHVLRVTRRLDGRPIKKKGGDVRWIKTSPDISRVTCPWCREVIRRVVLDWA